MILTKYSKYKLAKTADLWHVDPEYFHPMYNYLVHGFSPGSFFTALLANDAMGTLSRSHPTNSIQALKNLICWIQNEFPRSSYGNYDNVDSWINLSESERRSQLELTGLVLSERQEVIASLKNNTEKDMKEVLYIYNSLLD